MVERVVLAGPVPSAGGRVIVSPFQFQTTGEDNLRVEGWSSASSVTLVVQGRRYDEAGQQVPFSFKVPLTNDRSGTTRDFPLGVGYLVNLVAFVEGATPLVGQVFVCIKLIRGMSGATIVLGLLLQGYVTHEQLLGWPGSPIVDSISTGGVLRGLGGTDPAAGAEISETVPTGARWQLLSLRAGFSTSATVINRRPVLNLKGSGIQVSHSPLYVFVGENTNALIAWAQGMVVESVTSQATALAGLSAEAIMLAGDTVTTATVNIQPGDNWTAPNMLVREWLEAN